MSRKREQERENKKELARQLGVSGKVVPQRLLDHERVTEPRVTSPQLVVSEVQRGLFQKRLPASLRWVVWVKDGAGARFVGDGVYDVVLAKGDVALPAGTVRLADEVRYRRPGSFFVGAVVGEGGFVVDVADDPVFVVRAAGVYVASHVVELKAVDRVRELVQLPLVSADRKLQASLTLDVRL